MHIEPGVLTTGKIIGANAVALGLMGAVAFAALRRPTQLLRTVLAAGFFTLCMQAFHLKVGPSELHFLGAMPMFLLLGLVPTLLGFALGLLAQGWLFEPADLVHWSVNTLSLALPMLAVHAGLGRHVARVDLRTVLRLDAAYYAGVTAMVGFWLAIGEVATPWQDWLRFSASYLVVVALEPLLTIAVLVAVSRASGKPWVRVWFDARHLLPAR